MKSFYVAIVLVQTVLAVNQPAEVRPASDAILGGKPAPADGIQLIGQQCNLAKCFDVFKLAHAGDAELAPLATRLLHSVGQCVPQFEQCSKQLEAFIKKIKADRGIPDN